MVLSTSAQLAAMLPKTDLHVHFEGLVGPQQYQAGNLGSAPSESVYKRRFDGVSDMIHSIRQSNEVLCSKENCTAAVGDYLKKASAAGVCHIELAVEPEFHMRRGLGLAELFGGICSALDEGEHAFGITSCLILSVARDQSPATAFENLRRVEETGTELRGVGIAGYEDAHPLNEFRSFMRYAADRGYAVVAHAGEGTSAAEVWDAIREFPIHRIDHGVAAIADGTLLRHLRDNRIPLAAAPMSNHLTGVSRDGAATAALLRADVIVSANTDDPGIQQTTILDDFALLIDHQSITNAEIVQLVANGFESSFLPTAAKTKHLAEIRTLAEQFASQ